MTNIRVSDDVKERLEDLKRPEESFNDLLDRLSRTEKDIDEITDTLRDLGGEDLEQQMDEAHAELNDSLEERLNR